LSNFRYADFSKKLNFDDPRRLGNSEFVYLLTRNRDKSNCSIRQ
jgi:hypothetical protein